eukprot:TRINITY_DN32930_c0_g1_i3.p2 TRINITY_DN32930_c0_g1~~TRINITY_DN32930_c0_g1_i3.p2  ORF type:complete len:106 (-),score=5.03 TRINITY_DN32930_c0_g1_i3:692-1009(-)
MQVDGLPSSTVSHAATPVVEESLVAKVDFALAQWEARFREMRKYQGHNAASTHRPQLCECCYCRWKVSLHPGLDSPTSAASAVPAFITSTPMVSRGSTSVASAQA